MRAVIPTIITQALYEEEIRLGSLDPTRDLNYVADTVEGFVMAAATPAAIGETINLGTGRETSIRELTQKIQEIVGRDLPIVTDKQRIRPTKSEVERLCADTSKARAILGWSPAYTLEQGLEQTVEWIRENNERYRRGIYGI
jgi:dTDP-glucose 4,6-dehydratase